MENVEQQIIQVGNYHLVATKMLPYYSMQLNLELKEILYRLSYLNTTYLEIASDNNRMNRFSELDDCFTSVAFLMRQYKILTEKNRYLNEELKSRK